MNLIKVNIACRSELIQPVLDEVGKALSKPIRKTLYEHDVGEEPIEITLISVKIGDQALKMVASIVKKIPGVIFIEPVREEVKEYEFECDT